MWTALRSLKAKHCSRATPRLNLICKRCLDCKMDSLNKGLGHFMISFKNHLKYGACGSYNAAELYKVFIPAFTTESKWFEHIGHYNWLASVYTWKYCLFLVGGGGGVENETGRMLWMCQLTEPVMSESQCSGFHLKHKCPCRLPK